jgi:hypothetical protein
MSKQKRIAKDYSSLLDKESMSHTNTNCKLNKRWNIYHHLKTPPHKILITRKKENNFTMEKFSRHNSIR